MEARGTRDRGHGDEREGVGATRDLRALLLGAGAWVGALLGTRVPVPLAAGVALLAVLLALRPTRGRLAALCLATMAVLAAVAGLRHATLDDSVLRAWADERPVVQATVVVRSDPLLRQGRFGDHVVARAVTRDVTVRGAHVELRVPVLLLADPSWTSGLPGQQVRVTARLLPGEDPALAGILRLHGRPTEVAPPPPPMTAAAGVRSSVRQAAQGGPPGGRDLVPALVTGDDETLGADIVADFRSAGLTHLTAVSGTNLTLVLGSLLLLAQWLHVRGRGFLVVGLVGVAGFVLVAGPEPSVLRSAAMGLVALLGLGSGGRAAGVRALGVAVVGLLLLDPWLARTAGFALSALATGGILLVAPALRDALGRWLPGRLADATAVPVAAQLACTPLVAALSGEVSLVAVVANLVAAPAVGPATVLGLAGGLVGMLVPAAGAVLGAAAAWCAQLIVVTSEVAADLPGAAVAWPTDASGLAALTALTLGLVLVAPVVARRRLASVVVVLGLTVVLLQPLPTRGWPPSGWVLVMCDVGQGDAVVLRAGERSAVLVDAGPEPSAVDRCLTRLDVDVLPAVVLTHFHADHVAGLAGALEGRAVGEVLVSPLREPAEGARSAQVVADAKGVPVRTPAQGERAAAGDVAWQVVGPRTAYAGGPNDASLVLLADVAGIRVLLTGDVEPGSQGHLARLPLGPVDVLKVPHHGSAHQDVPFLVGLQARLALVPVGSDNDYGHPAPALLDALASAGAVVRRTDRHGDVAVVVEGDDLRVVSQRDD